MTRDWRKNHRLLGLLSCLLLLILGAGCASGYQAKAAAAQHAYFSGDYERALDLIEKVQPARRDRLLHLLDRGIILQAAGRYEESNRALDEAEEVANVLSARSVTKETAATLWSEEARDYPGERSEIAMIPVLRMLNYILLDQWSEALVEVRRLGNVVARIYGAEAPFDNAFSIYLSAIVWEALGHINDAMIDYRRLARERAAVPYYASDLKATSAALGIPASLPPAGSPAWTTSPGYRKAAGELVVVAMMGQAPSFVSEWVSTGLFTLSVPRLVRHRPVASRAVIVVDGREVGATHEFRDASKDALVALRERSKRSLVRKIVKTSVQAGLYTGGAVLMESDEVEEQLAGLALSVLALSMAASDKADERSVRLLPASYQIGRFYLAPGTHEIVIRPDRGGDAIQKTVAISRERPAVVVARFGSASASATPRRDEDEAASRLREEVRRRPDDGSLKIELAEEMVRLGTYDVAGLVREGMRQGGSARNGTAVMLAAETLKGGYPEAETWALRGRAMGERFAYCAQALAYLAGKRGTAPGPLSESRDPSIENAVAVFTAGLVAEKDGKRELATEKFAEAYELGLRGKEVAGRVIANYRLAGESFRESKRGADILTDFADSFVDDLR